MSEYKKKTITCDKKMSFQECELAILRMAVDLAQEKVGKRVINSPEVQEMIQILEDFLKKKFKGILLLISHDHDFLNSTCNNILDIDYHTITLYSGNYDYFVSEIIIKKKETDKKIK